MALWKRGGKYWTDVTVGGVRYREPLKTSDRREALGREKFRIAELTSRPPDPKKTRASYGSLTVEQAIAAYAEDRRAQVSSRMVAYWKENSRPLGAFFTTK